jgi:hypothetical protein
MDGCRRADTESIPRTSVGDVMPKLMFVCSTCGFAAFVERPMELEMAGWRGESREDGSSILTCSGCLADARQGQSPAAPDQAPEPAALAVAAPRVRARFSR